MDGIKITIKGENNLAKILAGLSALDVRPILDEGAAILLAHIKQRFLQETDPSGNKWPVSKAAQRRANHGQGGGTLYASGKLWRSLQLYAEDDNTRAIGTNATSERGFPYPIVHQFGLAGFPQREFLGFNDQDVQLMSDLVVRRLQEVLSV